MLSSHAKFSLHLCYFSARCLTDLLGPWDLGVVWLSQIAFEAFLLALVHLVLVHYRFVLPGVPLVPGVRPRDAGTFVSFSLFPPSAFFSYWWPGAWL